LGGPSGIRSVLWTYTVMKGQLLQDPERGIQLHKKLTWLFVALFLVVVVMPAILVKGLNLFRPGAGVEETKTTVRVKVVSTNTIKTFDLEQYIVGVVAGEMPARFQMEALKSQAVAARTYTMKRMQEAARGRSDHSGADLCTDPTHCQAWLSDSDMRQRWGVVNYYKYKRRIVRAVKETRGMVLTYKGKLIDPVYHSTCGGWTENPQEVWKFTAPYLRSVNCPYDRHSPQLHKRVKFSWAELDGRLGTNLAAAPGSAVSKVKIRALTSTGRVKTVAVGKRLFPGTEFRARLGLNSTRFTYKGDSRGITIDTIGYGHGVGLCQYGTDGYANHGKDFRFILQHYYQGSKITQLKY